MGGNAEGLPQAIPAWKAWYRKMITIRAVSDGTLQGCIDQTEYLRRISAIQQEAAATPDMSRKTAAFWRMENLSSYFLKQALPDTTLKDPALPLEVRPISHCGMGIGAVEVAKFDGRALQSTIDSFSDPDYRLFAYEGAGAMLALYEPDMFGLSTRGFAWMGLLPLAPLHRPEIGSFVGRFDPEIQRLIAHGYGRMLYFKNHTPGRAVAAARVVGQLQLQPCVQGIAFAYAMVNNSDLARVLATGGLLPIDVRAAFDQGLIYALEFWEWMAPGFLSQLKQRVQNPLIDLACAEIDAASSAGVLPAFRVVSE